VKRDLWSSSKEIPDQISMLFYFPIDSRASLEFHRWAKMMSEVRVLPADKEERWERWREGRMGGG
jgi:hypothetical protein